MSLLTSGSKQYLQPDYLQPISSSLDASKSPLALLAQTCNNIGKELGAGGSDGGAKNVILPLENSKDKKKKEAGEKSGRSSTGGLSGELSPKDPSKEHGGHCRDKLSYSGLNKDASSGSSRKTTSPVSLGTSFGSIKRDDSRDSHSQRSLSPKDSEKITNGLGDKPKSSSASPPSLLANGAHSHAKLDPLFPNLSSSLASYYSSLAMYGYPSLMNHPSLSYGLSGLGTAALLAAHKQGNADLKYTPVKTASGATTMVPMCSDPYCVHCKLALHSAQLTPLTCPAGCTQCNHDKGMIPGLGAAPGLPPPTSISAGLLGVSYPSLAGSLHSLYGHGGSPSTAGSTNGASPYVCSWNSPSGVCGKRFNGSEELMQHLRSHTTSLEPPSVNPYSHLPPLPSLYPPNPLAAAAAAAAASGVSLSTPSAIRQPYPRSYSPNSLLSASRFHPYLKSSVPGLSSADSAYASALGNPLSAYSHLYSSLYGSKLGVP